MRKNNLPNFLIVGAAKCGTTSLHNYLNQHPDIFLPSYNNQGMKVKEPRFLIKDLVQNRLHNGVWNWQDYQSLFHKAEMEKAVGESTVLYLYYYNHAIKNIKKYLGKEVKIIIMLRNPVDRAFSAYTHVARNVKENLTFEEALSLESERLEKDLTLTPMVCYKDMGLYFKMVRAYMQEFSKVKIILYDDFKKNTADVVNDCFKFLDVSTEEQIDTSNKYNVGGISWRHSYFRDLLMGDYFIKRKLKSLIPPSIRTKIRLLLISIFTRKAKTFSVETKNDLINFFTEDIHKLSKLLNKDLTHWLK